MSCNGTDADMSNSGGKKGLPVQRSSTHVKPNSSVDQEGIVLEQIRDLRKQKGGVLSSLTAKHREINSLLTDLNNLETVKVSCQKSCRYFNGSSMLKMRTMRP